MLRDNDISLRDVYRPLEIINNKTIEVEENNQQFFLLITENGQSFDDSAELCNSEELVLAKFIDRDEFDKVVQVLTEENLGNTWVGIARRENKIAEKLPIDFIFTDTVLLDRENQFVFNKSNGELPWIASEPSNTGGLEDCVEMNKDAGFLLNDVKCRKKNQALCMRPTEIPSGNDILIDEDFLLVRENLNFSQATQNCLDRSMALTAMRNREDYEKLKEIISNQAVSFSRERSFGVWLGLSRIPSPPNENRQVEPKDFEFTDPNITEVDSSFVLNKKSGSFPWAENSPGNSAGTDCVVMNSVDGFLLRDVDCSTSSFFVCSSLVFQESTTESILLEVFIGLSFILVLLSIMLFVYYNILSHSLLKKSRLYEDLIAESE